jgi:hypothetical protein
VEADLFHAEGRTELMKQIVTFHCFAKASKEENGTTLLQVPTPTSIIFTTE